MIWVHPNGHLGMGLPCPLREFILLGIAYLGRLTYILHGSRGIGRSSRKEGLPMLHSLMDLLIGIIASLLATAILRFLDSLELLK